MKLYTDVNDLSNQMKYETLHVAREKGFDIVENQKDGHALCGRHGTDEVIDVYPDGSWQLFDEDGNTENQPSGPSAVMLGICLENIELYIDTMTS